MFKKLKPLITKAHKSTTLAFNYVCLAASAILAYLEANSEVVRSAVPPQYGVLAVAAVNIANILIRLKTSKSLRDK